MNSPNNAIAFRSGIGTHIPGGRPILTPSDLTVARALALATVRQRIHDLQIPPYKIRRGAAWKAAERASAELSVLRSRARDIQALRVDAESWSDYVEWAGLVACPAENSSCVPQVGNVDY